MAIIIIMIAFFFYEHHGIKILIGIGIGAQMVGFVSILTGQNIIRIRDEKKFNEIFERYEKNSLPEILGSPNTGKTVFGIWIILFGLAFQLIGLFLM